MPITNVPNMLSLRFRTRCIQSSLAFFLALACMIQTPAWSASVSLNGPYRNDPAAGIPKRAYSPFDDSAKDKDPCITNRCEVAPNEVLIKLAPGASAASASGRPMVARAAATSSDTAEIDLTQFGVKAIGPLFRNAKAPALLSRTITPNGKEIPTPDLTRWYKASLNPGADIKAVAAALSKESGVAHAEPNYLRKPNGVPNTSTDPRFGEQWHLASANVPAAWTWLEQNGYSSGGSRDVVVAIIDTGVDYNHPDLVNNMWTNGIEIAGNNFDDDGNGFKDDIHGVNVTGSSFDHNGNPMDDHGHGTHVAGIVAAQGNNGIGGAGVAYNVKIMAIKAAQYSGILSAADVAEGVIYATTMGADVINMSFGAYGKSQAEEDALAIAFGQTVLVAAAGNDGKSNDFNCGDSGWGVMYPAGYNWVLGVMARAPSASSNGDNLADFSNYDCIAGDRQEYELMAPGSDILSALPNSSYASWDGTSMAAPVVSGIAALVRTRFPDKSSYPSRFIMGQLASTGALTQARTPDKMPPIAAHTADALLALTSTPKPKLEYLEHWLFDSTTQSSANNSNGRVDSGETIDLAITIKNRWGKADSVSVKLEAQADGAIGPDPCVAISIGIVDYGAVAAFATDDNGLVRDSVGNVTGVSSPFRFSVSASCPNDHLIPFKLTMTARNGMDPTDGTTYTTTGEFYMLVQRGRELPRVISSNMTLTKADYWIVSDATLIEAGATLTITEGTQVQFGGALPDIGTVIPKIVAAGRLIVSGSASQPVELFTGAFHPEKTVGISGAATLSYAIVDVPELNVVSIDHSLFLTTHALSIPLSQQLKTEASGRISNSQFKDVVGQKEWALSSFLVTASSIEGNLFQRSQIGRQIHEPNMGWGVFANSFPSQTKNNVFLNKSKFATGYPAYLYELTSAYHFPALPEDQSSIVNNAFLNPFLTNPNFDKWGRIYGCRVCGLRGGLPYQFTDLPQQ